MEGDFPISRRAMLVGGATAAVTGGSLAKHADQPAIAAEVGTWTASDLTIETEDGTITSVYATENDLDFTVEWANFDDPQTITMTFEARLPNASDAASTFAPVATGEFDLPTLDGTVSHSDITWTDTPFPIEFIAGHSNITPSHFENPDNDTEDSTDVEIRIKFDYGHDTVTVPAFSFAVNVMNLDTYGGVYGGFEYGAKAY